jgi:hypothetical protein
MSSDAAILAQAIADLTGEDCPTAGTADVVECALALFAPRGAGMGYSQLNELLVSLGRDRVDRSFFRFLVDGDSAYEAGDSIPTLDDFRRGVERFRRTALLFYGNFKFAFKRLSTDPRELEKRLDQLQPRLPDGFAMRHAPVTPLRPIASEDAHLLGFESGQSTGSERLAACELAARHNLRAYLASDHLDVYVATSMRERHEYQLVHDFTRDVFSHPLLQELRLRWFDPTQGSCKSRIDKGLSEGLMLKRAKCTLFLVQESDTLGKDSELASTLAQGKPVVAYVPKVDESTYVDELLPRLRSVYPGEADTTLVLQHLQSVEPGAAWKDSNVRRWLENPQSMDLRAAQERLARSAATRYDDRARTLMERHPLGIQVHLETGVANGVLVVRTIEKCATLLRRIVLGEQGFTVECVNDPRDPEGPGHVVLREPISGCIFRVVTRDEYLTNAFWNFYLRSTD